MEEKKPHPLLNNNHIAAMPEQLNIHQFNDAAIRHSRSLGDAVGMEKLGVHLVRLEPGSESTTYHAHQCDEEFLYILSGRGVAEIDDQQFDVGPGDFMGFVAGSLPHSMFNPHEEDLVYLMGGQRNEIDICDYPRINRRMYRIEGNKEYVDLENLHPVKPKA